MLSLLPPDLEIKFLQAMRVICDQCKVEPLTRLSMCSGSDVCCIAFTQFCFVLQDRYGLTLEHEFLATCEANKNKRELLRPQFSHQHQFEDMAHLAEDSAFCTIEERRILVPKFKAMHVMLLVQCHVV